MGVMKTEIPPEITAFKEKFFFGLTVRQLVCVVCIAALAVPTAIFGSKVLPKDLVEYLVVFEVIPFFLIGWFTYNDMPIEIIGKKVIKFYFCKQKRKFEYRPPIMDLQDEVKKLDLKIEEQLYREEKKNMRKRKRKKNE